MFPVVTVYFTFELSLSWRMKIHLTDFLPFSHSLNPLTLSFSFRPGQTLTRPSTPA